MNKGNVQSLEETKTANISHSCHSAFRYIFRNVEALYLQQVKLLSMEDAILKCQKVTGNSLISSSLKRHQTRFVWINKKNLKEHNAI
jgi:hypothetical protein